MTEAVRPGFEWLEPEPVSSDEIDALRDSLDLPPSVCRLLIRRGYRDDTSVRGFLKPRLSTLESPDSLPDLRPAVERIETALRENENILVHGDFDVDGMASAALLTRGLRALGARVEAFVPHRLRDGYDFGDAGLARAAELDVGLIVTADCGTTAVESIATAARSGRSVIVTDHHQPGPELPPATAVVNPCRSDSRYPFAGLCGVGVAFKLLVPLFERAGRDEGELNQHLDLVALGTIADRAPLVGENRALTRAGLRVLARTRKPGLFALLSLARLEAPVSAEDVGFQITPRLNAAGRIGAADEGLGLLLTESMAEAELLAKRVDELNLRRRKTDRRVLAEAEAQLAKRPEAGDRVVVLWGEEWHPGVIGIAASKIAERLGRPTVLIAFDGEIGRGSARSAGGLDMVGALERCEDLLERFGGHEMAAGLDIRRPNLGEFVDRLQDVAREAQESGDPGAGIQVDLNVSVGTAREELGRWLRHLEPFGDANPRPVVRSANVRFERVARVGRTADHLRAVLRDEDGERLVAIGFGMGERAPALERGRWHVAFELVEETWRRRRRLRARLLDTRPAAD